MARVAHCFLSMERHWRIALARNPMPIQIRCGTSSFPSRSGRACRDLAFQGQEQPVSHPVAGSSSNPVWLVEGCRVYCRWTPKILLMISARTCMKSEMVPPELGFSKVRRQHPLLMAPPWNESLAVFTLVLTQGLGAGNL